MKNTQKFKVTLNYHGELLTIFTIASHKKGALNNAIYQLAQKLERDLSFVRRYFNYKQNSYHVEEVKDGSNTI